MDPKPVLFRQFYPGAHNFTIHRSFTCRLNDGTITHSDMNLISAYLEEKTATKHISEARRKKIVSTLCGWRRFIPEYKNLAIQDVFTGIQRLKGGPAEGGVALAQHTIRDYITILKPFLEWLSENDICTLPMKKVRKIRPVSVNQETTDPESLYTPEEVKAMIQECRSARDRALLSGE